MRKHIFGYYNRKADCFEHFAIFDSFDQLVDYDNTLVRCSTSDQCKGFEFANYILYPADYTLYDLGLVDYCPSTPVDWFTGSFNSLGDYNDCLGLKKESDYNVERDSDSCDSEPIYSSQSPRS